MERFLLLGLLGLNSPLFLLLGWLLFDDLLSSAMACSSGRTGGPRPRHSRL
jgi:hypothetical protein